MSGPEVILEAVRSERGSLRRQEILTAALSEFGARGLSGVRLVDIARRVGISKATIYLYYRSKEDLARAVIRATVGEGIERAVGDLPDGPALERLRNFCSRAWEILRQPSFGILARLSASELEAHPELMRYLADELIERQMVLVEQIVTRGIERGELRRCSPAAVARVLVSTLVTRGFWSHYPALLERSMPSGPGQVVRETLSLLYEGLAPQGRDLLRVAEGSNEPLVLAASLSGDSVGEACDAW